MLSTKTNLEITEYHEKFFLGLSLRQLACFGVATVLAIATCFVCLQWLQLDIQLVSYIVMVEVLPFLGLGFISHNGYPFEKLVKIYWAWYCGPAEVAVCPRQEKNYVFTKKIGIGTLLVSIGILVMPIINLISHSELGYYIGLILIVVGAFYIIFIIVKYNGKLISFKK